MFKDRHARAEALRARLRERPPEPQVWTVQRHVGRAPADAQRDAVAVERSIQKRLRRMNRPDDCCGELDIELRGHIDGQLAELVTSECHAQARASIINVFIDSGGGSVRAALQIIAALSAHRARKRVHVISASSAALDIMLCLPGRKYGRADSTFLHHFARARDNNGVSARWTDYASQLLHERGVPPAIVARWLANGEEGQPFDATEAKMFRIVDRVNTWSAPWESRQRRAARKAGRLADKYMDDVAARAGVPDWRGLFFGPITCAAERINIAKAYRGTA